MIAFWLKAAGGIVALAFVLSIVLPWVWAKVKTFWGTGTGTDTVIGTVTATAQIAVAWSAVQTVALLAKERGDTATALAALALLPGVMTWDDPKPVVIPPAA